MQSLYILALTKIKRFFFWNDLFLQLTFPLPLTITFVSVNFTHLLGKLFSSLSCLFRVKRSKRHRLGKKTSRFYYVRNPGKKKSARRSLGSYVHVFYKLSTDQYLSPANAVNVRDVTEWLSSFCSCLWSLPSMFPARNMG